MISSWLGKCRTAGSPRRKSKSNVAQNLVKTGQFVPFFFIVLRAHQEAANLGSAIHCEWARYVWHRVAQKHNCATFSATTCAKRRLTQTNLGGDQGRLLREGEPEVLYLFRFNPRGSGRSQEQDVQDVHEVQNDWGECAKTSDVAGSRPHRRHINCTVSTHDWAAICAIYMLPMAAEDVVTRTSGFPVQAGSLSGTMAARPLQMEMADCQFSATANGAIRRPLLLVKKGLYIHGLRRHKSHGEIGLRAVYFGPAVSRLKSVPDHFRLRRRAQRTL